MNLTRHTTLEKFVGRDVVDSYELSQLLEHGERVLDVGTGGGVPGVVLAILRPDLSVSLCESTQKKARAVEAMVGELGLHVPVFPNRAEEVLEITTFDTLVARGLAPLTKVLTWLEAALGRLRPIADDQRAGVGRGTRRRPRSWA